MSKTISTRSAEFPGVPAVSLTVPDDWSPGPTMSTLMSVLAPATPGAFRANVVISTERLSSPPDLDGLAGGVRRRVADFEESHQALDRAVTVAERPAHLVQFTYRHPEAGTLAQSILSIPVEHEGVTDLFEVVGSLGANRIEEDAEVVTRVMQSVIFT